MDGTGTYFPDSRHAFTAFTYLLLLIRKRHNRIAESVPSSFRLSVQIFEYVAWGIFHFTVKNTNEIKPLYIP